MWAALWRIKALSHFSWTSSSNLADLMRSDITITNSIFQSSMSNFQTFMLHDQSLSMMKRAQNVTGVSFQRALLCQEVLSLCLLGALQSNWEYRTFLDIKLQKRTIAA